MVSFILIYVNQLVGLSNTIFGYFANWFVESIKYLFIIKIKDKTFEKQNLSEMETNKDGTKEKSTKRGGFCRIESTKTPSF